MIAPHPNRSAHERWDEISQLRHNLHGLVMCPAWGMSAGAMVGMQALYLWAFLQARQAVERSNHETRWPPIPNMN